jgi:hypothetical protein
LLEFSFCRFKPKYGTIVQNKDEYTIPLLMEQIPPPKVFKDAISSLSPVCLVIDVAAVVFVFVV